MSASPTPPLQPRDPAPRAFGESLPRPPTNRGRRSTRSCRGEATAPQIAALLVGLRVKGETADEVAGAAARAARRDGARCPPTSAKELVDTCGTGGGPSPTFNISTAAALLAAGAGVRIAKHGNRSFTSQCGSADVLEALGVPLDVPVAVMERALRRGRHRLHVRADDAPGHAPRRPRPARARHPHRHEHRRTAGQSRRRGRQVVGVADARRDAAARRRARSHWARRTRWSCTASPAWTRSRRSDRPMSSRSATARSTEWTIEPRTSACATARAGGPGRRAAGRQRASRFGRCWRGSERRSESRRGAQRRGRDVRLRERHEQLRRSGGR